MLSINRGLETRMVAIEISGKKYSAGRHHGHQGLGYTGRKWSAAPAASAGSAEPRERTIGPKDDPKVRTCLACQTAGQDGCPYHHAAVPGSKGIYDIQNCRIPSRICFILYPEAPLCRNCNAAAQRPARRRSIREGVWESRLRRLKSVSEMFMDCVMCGMCTPVCIADIAPISSRSIQPRPSAHFTEKQWGWERASRKYK